MKIGDLVEVDIGMGLSAIGEIVTEDQYQCALMQQRGNHSSVSLNGTKSSGFHHIHRSPKTGYRIRFLDKSTHSALDTECRKLTDKEAFVHKLKDDARIFEN